MVYRKSASVDIDLCKIRQFSERRKSASYIPFSSLKLPGGSTLGTDPSTFDTFIHLMKIAKILHLEIFNPAFKISAGPGLNQIQIFWTK
jgi:hypothetical protein